MDIRTHNGFITITSPTGEHRTFRIRTQPEDKSFAPGARIVSLLIGPDCDNWRNWKQFAFVGEQGFVAVWGKFRSKDRKQPSMLEKYARMLNDRERYERLGAEYLMEGHCRRCNRVLTNPESIKSGIGPTCAGKSVTAMKVAESCTKKRERQESKHATHVHVDGPFSAGINEDGIEYPEWTVTIMRNDEDLYTDGVDSYKGAMNYADELSRKNGNIPIASDASQWA